VSALADVGAARQDYGGVENRTAPRLSISALVRIDEELFNNNVEKFRGNSLADSRNRAYSQNLKRSALEWGRVGQSRAFT